jgi:hypothetical protein
MVPGLAGAVFAMGAACGGNDNGAETAAGRALEPEAQQRAESINLALADLPNGWRASAPETDDSGRDEFNRCVGVDYSGLTRIGDAESPDFAMGDAEKVGSQVVIFQHEQQAKDAMSQLAKGLGGADAEECFEDLIEETVAEEGSGDDRSELGEVDIGEFSFTPPAVDEAKAWQIVIPVEITSGIGEGLDPNVYLEIVTLREGDTIVDLATEDVATEFDRELRDKLVRTLARRVSESAS